MVKLSNTIDRSMFYGAKPIIFERAKDLRENPTKTEQILWEALRKKQMLSLRFKHQHPINNFIADFYCHAIKLVIEVDGEVHDLEENIEYDENRTAEFERYGINVIRFKNEEILNNIDHVKEIIETECKRLLGIE